MKPHKDPRLIIILTGVISFGAGYLVASNPRSPQPQGIVPPAETAATDWEEAKRHMDPGMRHVLGLDASPTPDNYQPKTWLPVNK